MISFLSRREFDVDRQWLMATPARATLHTTPLPEPFRTPSVDLMSDSNQVEVQSESGWA